MALYKIEWKRSAIKELRGLEKDIIKKILTEVGKLAGNPHPAGSKKLRGSKYSYRLKMGNYRVVYKVSASVLTIEIIRVGHRREIYK
jgi:mRNA interferase RelE/StbE